MKTILEMAANLDKNLNFAMNIMKPLTNIDSPESMIRAIQEIGIIPFSKNAVTGWSVQEITDPDFWFTSSDQLGPWDWKIEAVREGIVYGKFIGGKSAFATVEAYRHLMNWRRSLPKYRMAIGGTYEQKNLEERLAAHLSPTLLNCIRERESLESSEIRALLEDLIPQETRKQVGGCMEKYLIPNIKRPAVDMLLQHLDMGTWTIVGDITRVYKGPNCEYKGWQKNSITTPELLFGSLSQPTDAPSWARHLEEPCTNNDTPTDCTPEESREILISRIEALYPGTRKKLEKLI